MTPTPPSPEDDILDLDGLGAPAHKPKASTQESDFEKELEALFAEDLAQAEAAAAAKKPAPAAAVAASADDEDALLLQDILGDDAPAAPAAPVMEPALEPALEEDALDLSAFAEAAPAAQPGPGADDEVLDLSDFAAAEAADDDEVLDLSAFATDGPLDLTPPADSAGGKDGGIDIEGLDSLISELGDGGQTLAAAPKAAAEPEPILDGPLDGIDIHGLDDVLDVPKAEAADADDALDLSLGDLLEDSPADETAAMSAATTDDPLTGLVGDLADGGTDALDLTLPDLSEPEPGAVLNALDDGPALDLPSADDLAAAALSLVDSDLGAGPDAGVDAGLDAGLDIGLGQDIPDGEPAAGADLDLDGADQHETVVDLGAEMSLSATAAEPEDSAPQADALDLLDGFDAHMPEVASEVPLDAGTLLEQVHAEAVLGAVAGTAAASAPEQAATRSDEPAPAATQVILTPEVLSEMQRMLTELKHQVLGGSVTVVGMQGQLAEKEQIISGLEQRLRAAEEEAAALREELSSLRSALEEDGRTATHVKERLALLEDRQAQMDQDMRAEIERAVPREAAKVIREEIAALAESMND